MSGGFLPLSCSLFVPRRLEALGRPVADFFPGPCVPPGRAIFELPPVRCCVATTAGFSSFPVLRPGNGPPPLPLPASAWRTPLKDTGGFGSHMISIAFNSSSSKMAQFAEEVRPGFRSCQTAPLNVPDRRDSRSVSLRSRCGGRRTRPQAGQVCLITPSPAPSSPFTGFFCVRFLTIGERPFKR